MHASGCEKFEEAASGKYCFGMCMLFYLTFVFALMSVTLLMSVFMAPETAVCRPW